MDRRTMILRNNLSMLLLNSKVKTEVCLVTLCWNFENFFFVFYFFYVTRKLGFFVGWKDKTSNYGDGSLEKNNFRQMNSENDSNSQKKPENCSKINTRKTPRKTPENNAKIPKPSHAIYAPLALFSGLSRILEKMKKKSLPSKRNRSKFSKRYQHSIHGKGPSFLFFVRYNRYFVFSFPDGTCQTESEQKQCNCALVKRRIGWITILMKISSRNAIKCNRPTSN